MKKVYYCLILIFICFAAYLLLTSSFKENLPNRKKILQKHAENLDAHVFKQMEFKDPRYYLKKALKEINIFEKARVKDTEIKRKVCFISYAWEISKEKNERLQAWLRNLQKDLLRAGIDAKLDLTHMDTNIKAYMENNIREADFVILIGTPHLKKRIESFPNSNIAFEINQIKEKGIYNKNSIIPILFEGNFNESFPVDFLEYLIRDFRDDNDYADHLIQIENPLGLIPTILGLTLNDKEYKNIIKMYKLKTENKSYEVKPKA